MIPNAINPKATNDLKNNEMGMFTCSSKLQL